MNQRDSFQEDKKKKKKENYCLTAIMFFVGIENMRNSVENRGKKLFEKKSSFSCNESRTACFFIFLS